MQVLAHQGPEIEAHFKGNPKRCKIPSFTVNLYLHHSYLVTPVLSEHQLLRE